MLAAREYIDLITRMASDNPGASGLMESVLNEYMSCCGVPITEGFMDSKWDKIAKSRKEAEKKAAEKRKSEEKAKNDAEAYRISESTRASIAKFKDTASNDDASIIGEMKSFIGSHVTHSPQTNVPTMYPEDITDSMQSVNTARLHMQGFPEFYIPKDIMSSKEVKEVIAKIYNHMHSVLPSEKMSIHEFSALCSNPVKAMRYFLSNLLTRIKATSVQPPFEYTVENQKTTPLGIPCAYIEVIHMLTVDFIVPVCTRLGPPVIKRYDIPDNDDQQ